MREKRGSEKEYQNRSTPQVTMSDLNSSQFICSEIMTMHKTRFCIKFRWGVILIQLHNRVNSTFQYAKIAGPQGDAETALGNFAHIQMSFLLFSGLNLYEKGLEQTE